MESRLDAPTEGNHSDSAEVVELREEVAELKQQLAWFKKQLFGPKSERCYQGIRISYRFLERSKHRYRQISLNRKLPMSVVRSKNTAVMIASMKKDYASIPMYR